MKSAESDQALADVALRTWRSPTSSRTGTTWW
jgi:hypothetical protein